MDGRGRDPATYVQYCCSLLTDKAPSVPTTATPQMLSPYLATDNANTARNREEEHPTYQGQLCQSCGEKGRSPVPTTAVTRAQSLLQPYP